MREMLEFFTKLLDSSDWPPRWHCGRWTESHGWLYIISDLLIWSAYFSIPVVIIRYILKRQDIRFVRSYFLFAAFILACGATHFLDAVAFWIPAYRLNALARLITGVFSWITVFYMIRYFPIVCSLKSEKESEVEIEQPKKMEEKFRELVELSRVNAELERKEAEEIIRKKEEKYRTLIEGMTEAFVAFDKNLCFTYVNKKLGDISGLDPESMIGKHMGTVFPESVGSSFHKAYQRALLEQKYIYVVEFYPPFSRWFEEHIYPTADGLSVFTRDITDKKNAEEEITKLNTELEGKVIERTEELQAANKEMEAFTYSVSHDLRAPLRAIIGFTTILEEDYSSKLDDEAKRITGIIKGNTLKMGRLIDDLLAFSRMGRQDLVKTGIDTEAMVKEVIEELAPENNYCSVEWNIQHLPMIKGDINTIRQVWVNLISNAIKYSGRKEHPRIEIGNFIYDGQTAFFIKDNGVGFDNRYRDKLFKVFQRLHNGDEFEGTGVGLALVAKIISKHGGKTWAEAELDKGSCFYFSLPAD